MFAYWFMFAIALWAALVPVRLQGRQQILGWWLVGGLFALLIGFRHEVGGDWFHYLRHFEVDSRGTLLEAIGRGDPAYHALNWVVNELGGDIYWVNLVCGAIVMWGTVAFCRKQPRPWLALMVAVPYMLVVVAMGYSRQAVALGFALLALVAFGDRRVWRFVIFVTLAALFHKSAVLLMPIAGLASSRNRILTAILAAASAGVLYYLLLADSTEALWENYVESGYSSDGGMIRVLMNAVPAVVFLVFRKWLAPELQMRKMWSWISIFALVCVPLVSMASTAVDRVALYLIPLQLFVFSRLPVLAGRNMHMRTFLVMLVIVYYGLVQFTWLNFAVHAKYWVPYQFKPYIDFMSD